MMKMLIAGNWVEGKDSIEVTDPLNGGVIDTIPAANPEDVKKALDSAVRGARVAREMTSRQRSGILRGAAGIVERDLEAFARTIAMEGSKTIREARIEARRCVHTLTVSAEESQRIIGETIPFDTFPGGDNRVGYYYRFPIGIILAVTPFNDPLNLVAHKLGPAIAAGNAVVLKPATVTPLSALKLARAMMEAGLPPHVLNVVTGHGHDIGDLLVQDPRPRMISFTGGMEAGRHITRMAGIKKISMELGSNSPVLVLEDCDLDLAVKQSVSGAFWAAGQNCLGVQRIYVMQPLFQEFLERFVARTGQYKIGPKLDEDCDMGPMITAKEAARVCAWIDEAVDKGAKKLCGGSRSGALLEPTVLTDVPPEATIHRQEVFGPVVNIYPVSSLEEAISAANSLDVGLQAAVFTRDINKAFRAAYALECGGVMINDSTDYRLDSMPFGGIKNSGLGREGIKFSLQEMTEPKVISLRLPEK